MSRARLLLWSGANNALLVAGDALPAINLPAAARVTAITDRWCRKQRLDAPVIALVGAIGRQDGSLDWGVWVRVASPMAGYPMRQLAAFTHSAPDPIDRRLAKALLDVSEPSRRSAWIGFNPEWPEMVRDWISKSTGLQCDDIRPLRADATAVVSKCRAGSQTVFLTARPLPLIDPELCDVLTDHSPSAFPRTLAHDPSRGWWLTAEVGGLDAAQYVSQDIHRAADLFEAMANVQISTLGSTDLERLSYCVTRTAVVAGVDRLCEYERPSILVEVDRLWTEVGAAEAPLGWVHSDPAPDNIRVDDHGRIVLLDLEDPWYGPIPLMGALAIHSLGRRSPWNNDRMSTLGADAWRTYLAACGLRTHGSFDRWLRLAQLVRLIRRVERSVTESPLLLEEEVPRRSHAIRAELSRLCGR